MVSIKGGKRVTRKGQSYHILSYHVMSYQPYHIMSCVLFHHLK